MAATGYKVSPNAIAISGGALKDKTELLQVKQIEDSYFYNLKKTDRKLAKVLGFPMTDSRTKYFGNNQFLDYLAHLRDEKVDELIKTWAIEDDPMGEHGHGNDEITGPRCKQFAEANVPEIIEIVHPGFTTNDGTRFPEHHMKVISTPSRNINITVEMTSQNLDFMAVAAHYCEHTARKGSEGDGDDDDEDDTAINEPNVHWAKVKSATGGHEWKLSCCFRLECGKWKTHYKKVHTIKGAAPGVNDQILASAAKEMQHYYNENHVGRPAEIEPAA